MGIVIPYNDKTLALRLDEGSSTGAAYGRLSDHFLVTWMKAG